MSSSQLVKIIISALLYECDLKFIVGFLVQVPMYRHPHLDKMYTNLYPQPYHMRTTFTFRYTLAQHYSSVVTKVFVTKVVDCRKTKTYGK